MSIKHTPNDFLLQSYSFELPEANIAQYPADKRENAKLMVYSRMSETLEHKHITDLAELLPKKSLIIANNSRVFPARLMGQRPTGGNTEFLMLSPLAQLKSHQCTTEQTESLGLTTIDAPWYFATIQGLVRPAKQIKEGTRITFASEFFLVTEEKNDFGHITGTLFWQGDLTELFFTYGKLPLPPYIKRTPDDSDMDRYQTHYANPEKVGSMAAPTAGLHFTPELKQSLIDAGHTWAEVTLYVGYGTFSPVRTDDIREHTMHAEWYELSEETAQRINTAREAGQPIIAIGTTSARALESAYAYDATFKPHVHETTIFMYPGYHFTVIDGLLTNFHLPESSLLMLVSAFAGRENILYTYKEAVRNDYRFFSYGDAMLIV